MLYKTSARVSAGFLWATLVLTLLYKRGGGGGEGGNVTGNSYFYTFCTFLTFGALPVVKDAQTKWRPCNETTAKR